MLSALDRVAPMLTTFVGAACEPPSVEGIRTMKLSESIEESGFFWLPEEPGRQLPGVLRISGSGEANLEITNLSPDHAVVAMRIGASSIPNKASTQKKSSTPLPSKHEFGAPSFGLHFRDFKCVVGRIKKGFVTLEDCYYSSQNHQFSGFTTSTIHSNLVFIGVGYDAEDEITFSKIKFSVEGLDEWLGISGIHVDHNLGTEYWQKGLVHYEPPEDILISLPDEMEMIFGFEMSVPTGSSITEAKISQKAYIHLKSKKLRPLDEYLSLIFKFHQFFSFAINNTISLNSVTGFSSEITSGEKNREVPIKIYYRSTLHADKNPKIRWHDMLLSCRDINDQFEETLANWLQNHDLFKEAFNEYFSAKYGAYKYLEGEFLSLVRGIEAWHRKISEDTVMPEDQFENLVNGILENTPSEKHDWIKGKLKSANELSLRKRMKEMLEPFRHLYGNEKRRTSFISKVVNTRNYLTHFDGNRAEDAAKGKELWKLHMKLEALFQLHLLKMIGMDPAFIDKMANGNRNLRRKLEIAENDNS